MHETYMKKFTENKILLYSFNLTLLVIFLTWTTCFGQTKPVTQKHVNNDVMLAKEIHDSVLEHFSYPAIVVGANFWYKFTSTKDTTFIFDIVPYDPEQDYGFELYKCEETNCAEDIKNQKLRSVRSCASINHGKYSSSGISLPASFENVRQGPGFPYASALPIKAGDTYYLKINFGNCCKESCIQCNKLQKGFKLYLYNLWPQKPKRLMSKPIAKPKEIVLENVLFETNKSSLLKESYTALDVLVNQLVLKKTMTIEIKGHTDNTGDKIKNKELSKKRAKAVLDYLVSKNISISRLSYCGLGGEEPIATNETEEGRKKNRRVAFVVIRE